MGTLPQLPASDEPVATYEARLRRYVATAAAVVEQFGPKATITVLAEDMPALVAAFPFQTPEPAADVPSRPLPTRRRS